MLGGVRALYASADGCIRKCKLLDRDIEWRVGEYAFSGKRDDLATKATLFPGFEEEERILPYQGCCEKCNKWRSISKEVEQKVANSNFTCDVLGIPCTPSQDPRCFETWGLDEINEGSLKFANDDDDEFGVCVGLTKVVDSDASTECESDNEVISAKRCSDASLAVAKVASFHEDICGHTNPDISVESKAALLRLGAYRVTTDDINHLKDVVSKIQKSETCEKMIIRQLVVRNREALDENNPSKPNWLTSIDSEVGSLFSETNVLETADVSDLKKGDEILPCLMILTIKGDGRYKCRLVAAGNHQKVQPSEAYSGAIGHDAWMQHIFLGLSLKRETFQIDVRTAFLQTSPQDDTEDRPRTFLRPPKDLMSEKNMPPTTLWRVLRSIYGPKSAPAAWKKTLTGWLSEMKFSPSLLDDCCWKHAEGTIVLLYVDNVLAIGEKERAEGFLGKLMKKFDCTDYISLSKATPENPLIFLGHALWVERSIDGQSGKLHIPQEKYAEDVLRHFDLYDCRPLTTLNKDDFSKLDGGEPLDEKGLSLLRSIIGSLQYLCQGSRLDRSAAIGVVSEGQSKGTSAHVAAGKKILRYVRGTISRHLILRVKPLKRGDCVTTDCHFDSSYEPGRARSGGVVRLNNQTTYWYSRRQRCICLSTAEAELVAASTIAKEAIGARNYLESVWGSSENAQLTFKVHLEGGYTAANLISSGQASLRKVRHLSIAHLFVRQATQDEGILVRYVPTHQNGADMLTKVLGEVKVAPLLHIVCLY